MHLESWICLCTMAPAKVHAEYEAEANRTYKHWFILQRAKSRSSCTKIFIESVAALLLASWCLHESFQFHACFRRCECALSLSLNPIFSRHLRKHCSETRRRLTRMELLLFLSKNSWALKSPGSSPISCPVHFCTLCLLVLFSFMFCSFVYYFIINLITVSCCLIRAHYLRGCCCFTALLQRQWRVIVVLLFACPSSCSSL